jgi:molecular chaperone GrpE
MTEAESASPDDEILIVAPEAGPGDLTDPEVAYVVPAPAYESIATDAGLDPVPFESSQTDPTAPTLHAIATLGEALGRKLDALSTVFDREIRAEATREKVVDRLHAELQEYKQGLFLNILRPVFVDLIQLHDDMGKMVAAQPEPEGDVARLLALIQGFQQGIEDILYRQGVEPFAQDDDAFDPRRQRALSTVPTDDPGLNKRVAARLRKGFQAGDKVIRPEMVTVYSHKEKPATSPSAS